MLVNCSGMRGPFPVHLWAEVHAPVLDFHRPRGAPSVALPLEGRGSRHRLIYGMGLAPISFHTLRRKCSGDVGTRQVTEGSHSVL